VRSWLAQFEMRRAETLADALQMLSGGGWRPFAGGTDLMVLLEMGKLPPQRFVDIWNLPELCGIEVSDGEVRIGALATYTDLLEHPVIAAEFPLLCAAARETGAVAIQNRGTVGGNIANASPAADLPPALLVYDAQLDVESVRGRRRIPYQNFHSGYKKMDLADDELIVSVRVPRHTNGWRGSYRKVGTRRAQAISKVCFAALAAIDGGTIADIRIGLGSVAPTPVRARSAEAVLRRRVIDDRAIAAARQALQQDISPIDDMRSTAGYRLMVAGNLLEEFLA
jgi:CO/xanthine dehydrogenase FAD-binding subunit